MTHGGEEHVTGVVTKVSSTVVTVKTTDGKTVQVGFDAKTTYTRPIGQSRKPKSRSAIEWLSMVWTVLGLGSSGCADRPNVGKSTLQLL